MYFPPSGSTYTQGLDRDIIDCIEKDIDTYQGSGYILLCGDFNARTAREPDLIINDENDENYNPIFENYPVDKKMLNRLSYDTTIDTRGKDLLERCISHQLRIFNGRVLGDTLGHYTCNTPNGTSVVDYVIMSEDILDQVLYFSVSDFNP